MLEVDWTGDYNTFDSSGGSLLSWSKLMNKLMIVALLAGGGWLHFALHRPSPETSKASASLEAADTTETTDKTPQPIQLLAAPEERVVSKPKLAPEGTRFLLSDESITTDSGVTGFHPGTKVRVIATRGETTRVEAGGHQWEIATDRLTDDVDRAQTLYAASHEAQATAQEIGRQQVIAQRNQETQRQDAAIAAFAQQQAIAQREASTDRQSSGSSRVFMQSADNPLNRGAYGQYSGSSGGFVQSPNNPLNRGAYGQTGRNGGSWGYYYPYAYAYGYPVDSPVRITGSQTTYSQQGAARINPASTSISTSQRNGFQSQASRPPQRPVCVSVPSSNRTVTPRSQTPAMSGVSVKN